MKTSIITKKLSLEGKRIATREEIARIARRIGKDERRSINYLLEEGYIVRILRGYFYIRSLDERSRKTQDPPVHELVAMALNRKGVKKWYFALETALKLNLMTHEYFMTDYVITDSYRTTKQVRIIDGNFRFIKRSRANFNHGLLKKDMIWYSDRTKTVLDLSYRGYLSSEGFEGSQDILLEFERFIDKEDWLDYLADYPKRFRKGMERII